MTHAVMTEARERLARGLTLAGRLLRLIEGFRAAGVEVLPLKGPVLSQQLYGDPAERESVDLDILVRREDVRRAVEVLGGLGYRLEEGAVWAPWERLLDLTWELSLFDDAGESVDLHWDVAPRDYPFRVEPETLFASTEPAWIAGREVAGLRAECLFLYLAMHGAKHAWNHFKWVPDVARLIEVNPELNWAGVFRMAGERGGEHVVLLAALLARDLCGARVPEWVSQKIAADRVIHKLADGVKARFAEEDAAPLSAFTFTAFNAVMADRWWDKIRHYAALLKPTEADLRVVRLPTGLFGLYYLLRFFRLVAKYARRAGGVAVAESQAAASN